MGVSRRKDAKRKCINLIKEEIVADMKSFSDYGKREIMS